jgi:hypothetical protein
MGVTKSWGTFENKQAKEFVRVFYNLLSNLQSEGKKVALCTISSGKEPGLSLENIQFFFGQKGVHIYNAEDKTYGFSAGINETLISK